MLIPRPARGALAQREGNPGPCPAFAAGQDRTPGKLPRSPEVWFADQPPSQWLQHDFPATGAPA